MSSSLVVTLAVIGGVAWLAFLGVSALRTRGKEQVPQNLAPGRSDEELETNRLERFQQVAVLISGFMAVSLPLYFLGETERQDEFRRSVPRGVGRAWRASGRGVRMLLVSRRRWRRGERQLHREADRGHGVMGGSLAERRPLSVQPRRGELLGDLRAPQHSDAPVGGGRRGSDERGPGRRHRRVSRRQSRYPSRRRWARSREPSTER